MARRGVARRGSGEGKGDGETKQSISWQEVRGASFARQGKACHGEAKARSGQKGIWKRAARSGNTVSRINETKHLCFTANNTCDSMEWPARDSFLLHQPNDI